MQTTRKDYSDLQVGDYLFNAVDKSVYRINNITSEEPNPSKKNIFFHVYGAVYTGVALFNCFENKFNKFNVFTESEVLNFKKGNSVLVWEY